MLSQSYSQIKTMRRLRNCTGVFTKVDINNKLSNARMSLELIDSIKNVSARIDELRMIVKDGNKTQRLVERIERLVDTRMKLIYSFMDINPHINPDKTNPFSSINVTYKNFTNGFSRQVSKRC